MMRRHRLFLHAAFVGLVTLLASRAQAQTPPTDVFDQFFKYVSDDRKVQFQQLPGETVDPFTGTLRIVQEDISLPGKAGLDLHIVRTYSSKIWERADALSTAPLMAESELSVLGYGWTLHMGRLRDPNATGSPGACGNADNPIFEGADGNTRVFYKVSPGKFISRDFWMLEQNCSKLPSNDGVCIWDPDGVRYEFIGSNTSTDEFFIGTHLIYPTSRIVDRFENAISISYVPQAGPGTGGAISSILDTYGRTISFAYNPVSGGDSLKLDSITVNGKQYQYSYLQSAGNGGTSPTRIALPGTRRFLSEVKPPVGPSYKYEYGLNVGVAENQYALSKMTYPAGGTVEYTYQKFDIFTGNNAGPNDTTPFSMVSTRVVGGRDVTPGTWTYSYLAPTATAAGDKMNVTTITRPDTFIDKYTMFGMGYVGSQNSAGSTWKIGLTSETSIGGTSSGAGAQVETLDWDKGPIVVPQQSPVVPLMGAPAYGGSCNGFYYDNDVSAPFAKVRTVKRDNKTYTSTTSSSDSYGQPLSVTESGQKTRIITYTYNYQPADSFGQTLNLVRNRPTSKQVCEGTDCFVDEWTYYTTASSPTRGFSRKTEKHNGITTTFDYDSDGNLHTVTNAAGETLTLSDWTINKGIPGTANFNSAFSIDRTAYWDGRIKDVTDGNGNTTSNTYDSVGRLDTVTPPAPNLATVHSYDNTDGKWFQEDRGTGANHYFKKTEVDGLGRTRTVTDSEGTTVKYDYDNMGRVVYQSYPFKTKDVGEKTEYDSLGRVSAVTRGYNHTTQVCDKVGGCKTTYTYDATTTQANYCLDTKVDRKSGDSPVTKQCFEAFGDPDERRLSKVTDADSKVWTYTYFAHGDLKKFQAPTGFTPQGDRTFTLDANGLLKTSADAHSGTTTIVSRTSLGQTKEKTDARPVTATFDYSDPLSRLKAIDYSSGTAEDVAFDYDNANALTDVSSDNGGAFHYDRDELGRVATQTWTSRQGEKFTTGFHYNTKGCLYEIDYPGSNKTVVTQTCDTLNRVTSVMIGTSSIVSGVSYHPSGQISGMTFGNGKSTTVTFDDRARATRILSSGVLDVWPTYDGANNVVTYVNKAVTANARSMVYDNLNRLTDLKSPFWGNVSYTYDALGNRKTKVVGGKTSTFNYGTTNNRLGSATTSTPPMRPMTFTWNDAGLLWTAQDPAGPAQVTSTYLYDGLGRRVEKAVTSPGSSNSLIYHYDPSGKLLAETDTNGAMIREYYYVGNALVAAKGCLSSLYPNCVDMEYFHSDALGNVLARTDQAGAVVARFDYEGFGELHNSSTVQDSRLYNGRTQDIETGLYNYSARMYGTGIGRFLSPDPAWADKSNPQMANPYAYVLNNPYGHTDSTGMTVDDVGVGVSLGLLDDGLALQFSVSRDDHGNIGLTYEFDYSIGPQAGYAAYLFASTDTTVATIADAESEPGKPIKMGLIDQYNAFLGLDGNFPGYLSAGIQMSTDPGYTVLDGWLAKPGANLHVTGGQFDVGLGWQWGAYSIQSVRRGSISAPTRDVVKALKKVLTSNAMLPLPSGGTMTP